MMSRRHQERITITVRRTGLSDGYIRKCIQRSLVSETLSDADLSELRRIRRLQELGVNLPGIEVILRMRQRIRALQAQMERLEDRWEMSGWLALEDLEPGSTLDPAQRLLPWDSPRSEDEG